MIHDIEKQCSNKKLLINPDETLTSRPIENIIRLWDGSCFEINELAQTIIANNGLNIHPLSEPGKDLLLWNNKTEILDIINFPTLMPDYKNILEIMIPEAKEPTVSKKQKSSKKESDSKDCRKKDNCVEKNKICNPKTGRCVKKDSSALFTIALELLQFGYFLFEEGKKEKDESKIERSFDYLIDSNQYGSLFGQKWINKYIKLHNKKDAQSTLNFNTKTEITKYLTDNHRPELFTLGKSIDNYGKRDIKVSISIPQIPEIPDSMIDIKENKLISVLLKKCFEIIPKEWNKEDIIVTNQRTGVELEHDILSDPIFHHRIKNNDILIVKNPHHTEKSDSPKSSQKPEIQVHASTDLLPSPSDSSSSKEIDIQKIILAEHLVDNNFYDALKIANKLFIDSAVTKQENSVEGNLLNGKMETAIDMAQSRIIAKKEDILQTYQVYLMIVTDLVQEANKLQGIQIDSTITAMLNSLVTEIGEDITHILDASKVHPYILKNEVWTKRIDTIQKKLQELNNKDNKEEVVEVENHYSNQDKENTTNESHFSLKEDLDKVCFSTEDALAFEDLTEIPFSEVFVYGGKSPIDIRDPNNLGKDINFLDDEDINQKILNQILNHWSLVGSFYLDKVSTKNKDEWRIGKLSELIRNLIIDQINNVTDKEINTNTIEQMTQYILGHCRIILFGSELKSGENTNLGEIQTQEIKVFDSFDDNKKFIDSVFESWNRNATEIIKTPEEIEEFIEKDIIQKELEVMNKEMKPELKDEINKLVNIMIQHSISLLSFYPDKKGQCYELETFYNFYKSQIESGKTEIKDPITMRIIDTSELKRLVEQMKLRCKMKGLPFEEAKYTLIDLDEENVKLVFEQEVYHNVPFFHLKIKRTSLPDIDLGVIPASIETHNNGTGAANETSGSLLSNIQQLWDKRKLLTNHSPNKNITCCTIELNKTPQYWLTKQGLTRFYSLIYQVEDRMKD
jgi:hypothetical protein